MRGVPTSLGKALIVVAILFTTERWEIKQEESKYSHSEGSLVGKVLVYLIFTRQDGPQEQESNRRSIPAIVGPGQEYEIIIEQIQLFNISVYIVQQTVQEKDEALLKAYSWCSQYNTECILLSVMDRYNCVWESSENGSQ